MKKKKMQLTRSLRSTFLMLCSICLITLFCSAGILANESVFDVEVAEGAEYHGYIFKVAENTEAPATVQSLTEADSGISVVYEPQGLYLAESIEDIESNVPADSIAYIEPNYMVELFDGFVNDPYYANQWGLDMTRGEAVWSAGLSGTGAVIGVIDSGLYKEHEDINASNVVNGWNYHDDNSNTADQLGHGTFVTSIIAATTNNGKGIASLGYGASIVPLKIFGSDPDEGAPLADILVAIYDAVNVYHCDVINMSFGGPGTVQSEYDAVKYAYDHGVICIAAAGNHNEEIPNQVMYPAAYTDCVIGVGAINQDGVRAEFSNYNYSVQVVAPGVNIPGASNIFGDLYGSGGGTSFAAPQVAALAAIAKSYDPAIEPIDFKSFMKRSAVYKGDTDEYGFGLIDAGRFALLLTDEDFFHFSDVADDYWAADEIKYCVRFGIFRGSSPTTFSPYENMSRAAFVTTLGRLYEMSGGAIPYVTDDGFSDTVDNSYYSKYVAWAVNNGIVGGYGDGRFGPEDGVSRQQLAVMLYRYAQYCGVNIGTVDLSVLNRFSDANQISEYAKTAMAWLVQEGFMSGTTPTTLSPAAISNRAQTASILYGYSWKYANLSFRQFSEEDAA